MKKHGWGPIRKNKAYLFVALVILITKMFVFNSCRGGRGFVVPNVLPEKTNQLNGADLDDTTLGKPAELNLSADRIRNQSSSEKNGFIASLIQPQKVLISEKKISPPSVLFRPRAVQRTVRVGIIPLQNSVKMFSLKGIKIFEALGESTRFCGLIEGEVVFKAKEKKIEVVTNLELKQNLFLHKLLIISELPVNVEQHSYRGEFEIQCQSNTEALTVINILPVEDYLKGVVPYEIGKLDSSVYDALKVQAVAARTYTLSKIGQNLERGFDVWATVEDQVYSGIKGEYPLCNRAIDETRGQVILYQDQYIQAYYFSTCGGNTTRIEEVWNKPAQPYLVGVKDESGSDVYCGSSKYFQWTEAWGRATLDLILNKTLADEEEINFRSDEIVDFNIVERGQSGRVKILEIVTRHGSYQIFGDRVRWVLRRSDLQNSILRSSYFDLEKKKNNSGQLDTLIVHGRGFGHGVGLCQVGAIGMARRGYHYIEILQHYYKKVGIVRVY